MIFVQVKFVLKRIKIHYCFVYSFLYKDRSLFTVKNPQTLHWIDNLNIMDLLLDVGNVDVIVVVPGQLIHHYIFYKFQNVMFVFGVIIT